MYSEYIYLKFNRSHMILVSKCICDYVSNLAISPYNLYQVIPFNMKFKNIFIKFNYDDITNVEIDIPLQESNFLTYIYENICKKFKNVKILTINFHNDNEFIIEEWPENLNTLILFGNPNSIMNYPILPEKLKYLKLGKLFIEKNIYYSFNLFKNKNINNDINIIQDNEVKDLVWMSHIEFIPIINDIIKEKISINMSNLIITYLTYF